MTEKRFTTDVVDWWHNVNEVKVVFDNGEWIDADKCCDLLNTQHEQIQELKNKYDEQSVQYEGLEEQVGGLLDFKDNVFNLINIKINELSNAKEDAKNENFTGLDKIFDCKINTLKDLRERLKE